MGRDPSQDVTFFYTGYHFSELQSCTVIFQPIFIFFLHLNSVKQKLIIELCRALSIYLLTDI